MNRWKISALFGAVLLLAMMNANAQPGMMSHVLAEDSCDVVEATGGVEVNAATGEKIAWDAFDMKSRGFPVDEGNHYYKIMYLLDKLRLDMFDEALMDENLVFRDRWAQAGQEHADKLWYQLHSYLLQTQRNFYKFEPTYSYIPGKGSEQYNFGKYISMVNVRAKNSKKKEFENFVHQIMTKTAEAVMPHRELPQIASAGEANVTMPEAYKLAPFVRVADVYVRSDRQIELQKFLVEKMMPMAEKLGQSIHYYRVGYGRDEFFMYLLPFEEKSDLAASRTDSVFSLMFQKADPENAAELEKEFLSYLWKIEEQVHKVRPDMSTFLENRFVKSWW